jgi:hypothetical protein
MLPEETVEYPILRKRWRSGELPKIWRAECPLLFDEDDFRLTPQASYAYHFGEWFGAIYYYKKGYQVLVEQYVFRNHPRQVNLLKQIVGKEGLPKLRKMCFGKTQPPDLFVYKDSEPVFFVEVKMEPDKLGAKQVRLFIEIQKELNIEVRLLHLRPQYG